MLDWCGKYGLSDKDQTLLGHHALKGESMYSYMRDKLASPLRAYEQMLQSVRHALFLPDSTRSGMFSARPSEGSEVPGRSASDNLRGVIPEERSVLHPGCTPSDRLSEAREDRPTNPVESEHEHYAAVADSPKSKAQSILDEVWPPHGEEGEGTQEAAGVGGSPLADNTRLLVILSLVRASQTG